MRTFILFALVALVGCDRTVSRELVGVRSETKRASCYKVGFCFTCIGIGKVGCRFQFSTMCPGDHEVENEVQTYVEKHESGDVRTVLEERTVRELSQCE